MSDHDPMCISQSEPSFVRFCDCKRVAQIRADERNTVATKRTEMTEFKPGDRVKVEFEGRVVRYAQDGFYAIYADYGGEAHYHERRLTLLDPEEPTGVGAVVRDAKGVIYSRYPGDGTSQPHWMQMEEFGAGDIYAWSEVCGEGPIEVLYEGVQP